MILTFPLDRTPNPAPSPSFADPSLPDWAPPVRPDPSAGTQNTQYAPPRQGRSSRPRASRHVAPRTLPPPTASGALFETARASKRGWIENAEIENSSRKSNGAFTTIGKNKRKQGQKIEQRPARVQLLSAPVIGLPRRQGAPAAHWCFWTATSAIGTPKPCRTRRTAASTKNKTKPRQALGPPAIRYDEAKSRAGR